MAKGSDRDPVALSIEYQVACAVAELMSVVVRETRINWGVVVLLFATRPLTTWRLVMSILTVLVLGFSFLYRYSPRV